MIGKLQTGIFITGSSPNTDDVQPPKITISPGENVQQAVCHIRVAGLLIRKKKETQMLEIKI